MSIPMNIPLSVDGGVSIPLQVGEAVVTEPIVDPTLTISGAAADAKVTGDAIDELKSASRNVDNRIIESMDSGAFIYDIVNDPANWEQGNIDSGGSSSTGGNIANTRFTRMKQSSPLYAPSDIVIAPSTADTAFWLYAVQYSDEACSQYVAEFGNLNYGGTSSLTLPKGYFYRLKGCFNPTQVMYDEQIAAYVTKFNAISYNAIGDLYAGVEDAKDAAFNGYYVVTAVNDTKIWEQGDISNGSDSSNPRFTRTKKSNPIYADHDITVSNSGDNTAFYLYALQYSDASCNNYVSEISILNYDKTSLILPKGYYYRLKGCFNPTVPMYETEIAELVELFSAVQGTLAALGSWKGKKWVAVGDSLTEHNQRSTKNYDQYVSEATGITAVNMGRSGTGYKRTDDEGFAFYQRVLNVPTDADVVTIFGSGNDLNYTAMGFSTFAEALGTPTDTTTDTICGCINKTIENLYSVIPTVQLGIVTPAPWIGFNPWDVGNNMDLYSQAIIEICNLHGIPCLDLYHCSGLRPWEESYRQLVYSRDEGNGVHPNELGHKILAPHFKAFLDSLVI